MTEHALSAEPTHSVWDRSLPPRLRIEPGDEVQIECVDASGGQVKPGMTTAEYLAHRSHADSRADRADLDRGCGAGRRAADRCAGDAA